MVCNIWRCYICTIPQIQHFQVMERELKFTYQNYLYSNFVRYKWFEAIIIIMIIIIMNFVPRDSFPFKSFLHKIRSTQNPKGHLKRVVWIGGCNKSYVFNSQTVNQSCIFLLVSLFTYTKFHLCTKFHVSITLLRFLVE